jgi:hypothetical protein
MFLSIQAREWLAFKGAPPASLTTFSADCTTGEITMPAPLPRFVSPPVPIFLSSGQPARASDQWLMAVRMQEKNTACSRLGFPCKMGYLEIINRTIPPV